MGGRELRCEVRHCLWLTVKNELGVAYDPAELRQIFADQVFTNGHTS